MSSYEILSVAIDPSDKTIAICTLTEKGKKVEAEEDVWNGWSKWMTLDELVEKLREMMG